MMILKKESRPVSKSKSSASLKEMKPIELLKPSPDGGLSVMKALQQRKTSREISDKRLPLQLLSDLLWAACGVNRKKGPFGIPGRTAASASNSQEIDIYVAFEDGMYLYDAVHNKLIPVVADDLRALALGYGQPDYTIHAPVHLIYIADIDKLANTKGYQEPGLQYPEVQKSYYYADTGIIAGNVYLFAASMGLVSWFHNCNKPGLADKLALRPDQRILFGQTVGYAVKK